jgi:glycosyltransferase involved in cell wall biosynthesis
MLGTFPAVTETFVLREIIGILNRGFYVSIFAVRRSDNGDIERSLCSPEIEKLCSYARPDNVVKHLIDNIKNLVINPIPYLSTLNIFLKQILRVEPPVFFRLLYHFFCGIAFSEDMRKKGIDHIHCHFSTGSNMGLAASHFLGISFSFTAHASEDIFVKPVLLEEKIKHATLVVGGSEYSKKYLDSVTGYKYSHKLHYVYNGVEISEPERFLAQKLQRQDTSNIFPRRFRIISVGSLVGCKGHATLIKACKILKERGHEIECKIVGDGPEQRTLSKLIKEYKLDDILMITGYIPLSDVYEELAKADIFSLLTEIHINGYRDGFPTVILEAMLMSLPVVSTWISGIPDMVINGETGFLVHEREPVAAADAIEKLITDEQMRQRMGKAGRQRVLALFDSNKNIDSLVHLFYQYCQLPKRIELPE